MIIILSNSEAVSSRGQDGWFSAIKPGFDSPYRHLQKNLTFLSIVVNLNVLNFAGVAQPVEQLICNQQVGGSNPFASYCEADIGEVPEWSKGADCKSVASGFVGSNPTLAIFCGSSSVGRASAFQADCRGFESRLPLFYAPVAQVAERILGKDEVTGSIPVRGFEPRFS